MPNIDIIRSAIAELPKASPLVVALPGGTTGIGSYIAKALATTFASHGSKLRVYIIGRSAARAEAVIKEGQKISPGSDWRLILTTDLALISEVDRCCADIIRQETEAPFHGGPTRLDLLYMTYSYPLLKEQSTTKEGLDAFMSTLYYSRIRFITQLLPLLTASPVPGHVISVYAGNMEDAAAPPEELMGCPPPAKYGINSVRRHTSFMKSLVFEELAERHGGKLSLTHIYPGLVDGPGFYSPEMPLWFRIVWRVMKPIAWLYLTSPDVCGQVMVYLASQRYAAKGTTADSAKFTGEVGVARATTGELGGGSYAVGQRADESNKISFEKFDKNKIRKEAWEYTMGRLEKIAQQNNGT